MTLEITVRPTADVVALAGADVWFRVWKGRTARGLAVQALVRIAPTLALEPLADYEDALGFRMGPMPWALVPTRLFSMSKGKRVARIWSGVAANGEACSLTIAALAAETADDCGELVAAGLDERLAHDFAGVSPPLKPRRPS